MNANQKMLVSLYNIAKENDASDAAFALVQSLARGLRLNQITAEQVAEVIRKVEDFDATQTAAMVDMNVNLFFGAIIR